LLAQILESTRPSRDLVARVPIVAPTALIVSSTHQNHSFSWPACHVAANISLVSSFIFWEIEFMARKGREGGVNKSAAIRELLKQNPKISAADAIAALANKGVKVQATLFYFVKGHMKGRKGRRKYQRRQAAEVIGAGGDPVAAIMKVKQLADELGGMKKLRALVEAMS
jgi:hypothetical protein